MLLGPIRITGTNEVNRPSSRVNLCFYRFGHATSTIERAVSVKLWSWTDGGREIYRDAIRSGEGLRHHWVHLRWWRYVFRGSGTAKYQALLW